TIDDRRPMDLKKPCRFGRTLTKSSLFTACEPCGPAKTNDSAYCAAMVAGSEPRMFASYVSKNALTRSLACGTAAFLLHCCVPRPRVHHARRRGRNPRRCDIERFAS